LKTPILPGKGKISRAFESLDLHAFEEACRWVKSLPYQRNSTKEDDLIVIKEKRGTCSSKHQVIKRLAEESGVKNCELILCMFKMNAENMPSVSHILEKYKLTYIPEAHTYILKDGKIMDLTFPDQTELTFLDDILFTEAITADQIKSYKVKAHKAYLADWIKTDSIDYTLEEIWDIREQCVLAMGT